MKMRCTGVILLVVAVTGPGPARAAEVTPKLDQPECGTFALYQLLRLTGRSIKLDELRSVLGTTGAGGHSFRELRDAAGQFGLSLDAVILPKQRSAIDGPTLLFIKLGLEGHFLLVRPIGHTGHLVQVLDGPHPPLVADAERIFDSPSWTGLALVPHQRSYLGIATVGLAIACTIAFFSRYLIHRRQRSCVDDRPKAIDFSKS